MDLILTDFSSSDLQEVLSLNQLTGSTDWSPQLFNAELSAPHRINLVARNGDELVGFVFSSYVAGELSVLAIAVDPVSQRQGIGRWMIAELISRAKKSGCEQIFLEVRGQNTGAQEFYRSCGFKEFGVRRGYYTEPRSDDAVQLVMTISGIEN